MAQVKIIRDSSIRVKVQPETKARLERIAHLLGVPPATLAAVWLGQAITTQERTLSMVSKMAESIGGEVGKSMSDQMSLLLGAIRVDSGEESLKAHS